MKRARVIAAALVLSAAAIGLPWPHREATLKFDRALREWMAHPTPRVRVLISTQSAAAAARVRSRVDTLAPGSVVSASPRLIVATLDQDRLRSIADNPDVARLSLDAVVRTLGTSYLSQNILLNTSALLPRQSTGANVGVAVIDSGYLPNANVKLVATYDFIKSNGKKVGASDAFGHGTHVGGLLASKGTTSSDLYEGIAPGVKLYALQALDATGSGYTSSVINAINFAVANKDALGLGIVN